MTVIARHKQIEHRRARGCAFSASYASSAWGRLAACRRRRTVLPPTVLLAIARGRGPKEEREETDGSGTADRRHNTTEKGSSVEGEEWEGGGRGGGEERGEGEAPSRLEQEWEAE
eukprot:scaffold132313_cov36-Tisochrysis_lutea.AAC.1